MRVDKAARYTRTHEWVRVEGEQVVSGISDYAQEHLSDIVFVDLPGVGEHFDKGEVYGVVESVKAASDCYMPVAGTIAAVNEELANAPATMNEDPYGAGWMIRFTPDNPDDVAGLMDVATYEQHAAAEGGH
ncbi:MAG TPA: glycine cleavage system protein GcvH [Anaerolineae bacterium]|nr:glycine cleavage system protein GcvH [Anaerolineae bacterium]HPL27102.1 glycine cleavage system protein GcvH [Anaerolineae bacterium]